MLEGRILQSLEGSREWIKSSVLLGVRNSVVKIEGKQVLGSGSRWTSSFAFIQIKHGASTGSQTGSIQTPLGREKPSCSVNRPVFSVFSSLCRCVTGPWAAREGKNKAKQEARNLVQVVSELRERISDGTILWDKLLPKNVLFSSLWDMAFENGEFQTELTTPPRSLPREELSAAGSQTLAPWDGWWKHTPVTLTSLYVSFVKTTSQVNIALRAFYDSSGRENF